MVVLALAASWLAVGAPRAHALNGKVLIIDTTLSNAAFTEVDAAATLGLGADVVTEGQWSAMSTADFAQYDAIVFADPLCSNDDATLLAAPLANLSTWTPAITGNVIVHTFDSTDHGEYGNNSDGAKALTTRGIAFATAQSGTGMYLSSSCYNGPAWTDLLDGISPGWTATAQSADEIHVTGSTPALSSLTDATLSNFGSSVHNLVDTWPSDFTVFAIATGAGNIESTQGGPRAAAATTGPYTAPDGTQGAPVLLIRGAAISASHILLQPDTQTHDVGGTAHLVATVTDPNLDMTSAAAVSGITVTFTAVSGPNAGKTAQGVTDADGNVGIDQTSAAAGTDTWEASYFDPFEVTETSNQVTVAWTTPEIAPVVIQPRFTG
jgi:hypothetical protein